MKKLLASGLCICASFGFPCAVAGSPHAKVSAGRKPAAVVKVEKVAKVDAVNVKLKGNAAEAKPVEKPKVKVASKFSSFSAVDKAPVQQDESWSSIDSKDINHVDVDE